MATWQRGQAWRVVNSLQTLNAQLRERYARAAPPATPATSWGSIADDAHSSSSDHYPHFYAALGSMAVVCARDFPHAASLGMDAGQITEALRLSRDPRIAYVIFAGRIFSSTTQPWVWRPYSGSDGHWTHFHVSTVHTAAADDSRPWALPGGTMTGTDMELSTPTGWTKQFLSMPDGVKDGPWLGGTVGAQLQYIRETTHASFWLDQLNSAALVALTSVIESLGEVIKGTGGSADTAAILAGVDERLAKLAAEQRDAVADLGEGGAAQVRADA